MLLLTDKSAVVTGASSGIGRAIALSFAAAGARVALADLREEPIEGGATTADLIRDAGGTVFFRTTDVASWSDVDAIVSEAVSRWERLDVMVYNAAVYSGTPLLDTTEDHWASFTGVNFTGQFLGCKRAVPDSRALPGPRRRHQGFAALPGGSGPPRADRGNPE